MDSWTGHIPMRGAWQRQWQQRMREVTLPWKAAQSISGETPQRAPYTSLSLANVWWNFEWVDVKYPTSLGYMFEFLSCSSSKFSQSKMRHGWLEDDYFSDFRPNKKLQPWRTARKAKVEPLAAKGVSIQQEETLKWSSFREPKVATNLFWTKKTSMTQKNVPKRKKMGNCSIYSSNLPGCKKMVPFLKIWLPPPLHVALRKRSWTRRTFSAQLNLAMEVVFAVPISGRFSTSPRQRRPAISLANSKGNHRKGKSRWVKYYILGRYADRAR